MPKISDTPETVKYIEQCISSGSNLTSSLSKQALNVPGFTSPKIRHLLNNLGTFLDINYLEIGVHRGGTFISSNYNNTFNSSIAVDNWSEFEDGTVKQEFLSHCDYLLKPGSYKFFEQDCFTLTKEQITNPVNLYLYDGNHGFEAQYKALSYMYPMLDDVFILLVDDFNWKDVKDGTYSAIKDLNLKTVFNQELTEEWWNGFLVTLLRK